LFKAPYTAEEYVLVIGQKGIGKSCAIDTATERMCGVIRLKPIGAGTPFRTITEDAFRKISRIKFF